MKNIYTFGLLLLFYFPSYLEAVISLRLIKSPKGKLVLILGDIHGEVKAQGFSNLENIGALIKGINGVAARRKLSIILESCNDDENYTAAITLQMFKDAWSKKNNSVTLEHFDPRLGPTSIVNGIFINLKKCMGLAENRSESFSPLWRNHLAQCVTDKNSGEAKAFEDTVGELLGAIEEENVQLARLFEKYKTNDDYKTVFKRSLVVHGIALEKIQKKLRASDKNGATYLELSSEIAQGKNDEESMKYLEDEWMKLYLYDTQYNFFDHMLLDKILSDHPLSPVVLFIGENHATTISKLIGQFNEWSLLKDVSLVELPNSFLLKVNPVQDFQHLLREALSEVLEYIQNSCDHCFSIQPEMKRCSQCHEARYCGMECQKASWQDHKKVCIKVRC